RHLRDDVSERRLAGAGWAGQDDRRQPVGLDGAAQKFARPKDVLLPDEFVERARTHPRGQRRGIVQRRRRFTFTAAKKILHEEKIRSANRSASAIFRDRINRIYKIAGRKNSQSCSSSKSCLHSSPSWG